MNLLGEKYINVADFCNNGARELEFGSLDGGEDDEYFWRPQDVQGMPGPSSLKSIGLPRDVRVKKVTVRFKSVIHHLFLSSSGRPGEVYD